MTSEKVIPRWEQDYQLQPSSKLGLFYEYLEMGEMAIHYWHSLSVIFAAAVVDNRTWIYRIIDYFINTWCTGKPLVPYSHPIWLCDPVCGLLPSGSGPGSAQQYNRNSGWCLENHHSVSPWCAREGTAHRSLAAHSSRHHYPGCGNKCKLIITPKR